jgi:hypothetical protein
LAIRFVITIEEGFGIIQKFLVPGFEAEIRKLGLFRAQQSIASAGLRCHRDKAPTCTT